MTKKALKSWPAERRKLPKPLTLVHFNPIALPLLWDVNAALARLLTDLTIAMPKHTSSKPEPGGTPQSVNPHLQRKRRADYPADYYRDGILAGDRVVLSQAITLVESTRMEDRLKARSVVESVLPHTGRSFRLGITGVPGVGKSTFIENLGLQLIERGHRLAVLAVDPSSQVSRGSILGDKTRMAQLATHPKAYIRPSAAGQSLGGVAAKTRELILLCEAAGYDYIIVETVGVGQSEVAVHALSDFFLLLLLPGGGDELQGIKRGVVEMADLIAVNKADDDRLEQARKTRAAYSRALHLFPPKASGWTPQAYTCSALTGDGIPALIDHIGEYEQQVRESHYFERHRQQQALHWLHEILRENLLSQFYQHPLVAQQLPSVEKEVANGRQTPLSAAESLLSLVNQSK